MRVVEKPTGKPGFCAVISGKAEDPQGFVHTGQIIPGWDPEVVVSATAVREMARLFGFESPESYAQLEAERDEAVARAEALEAERDELQRRFDAIDILASAGFRARQKPGRRPASKENANG